MTHINPDDPKWTAYVLGEMDDSERQAIELELASSEEARTLVEELRLAVDLTKSEMRQEMPIVPLTMQERAAIRAAAEAILPRRWFGARPAVVVAGLAAAVIVLAVALSPMMLRLPEPSAPEQPQMAAVEKKQDSEFELRYEHAAPPPAPPQIPGPPESQAKAVELLAREAEPSAPANARVSERDQDAANAVIPGVTSSDSIQVAENAPAERDIKLEVAPAAQALQVQIADPDAEQTRTAESAAAPASLAPGVVGGSAFAEGGARAGVLGGVLRAPSGQIQQEARNNAVPVRASDSARAPGVPPGFDRIAPGIYNREPYDVINDNPFLAVGQNPLSTFSIDVDTASYSNVRRFLNQNQMPPRDAVRIEEMVNYFTYGYAQPSGNNPIGAAIDAASAPWNPQHRLVRIGIKARDVAVGRRPPANFVFLLDVSGSMQPPERLPLLKEALRLLVDQLTANDRVTVVTYAGTTGVALRPTRGDQKDVILRLIDSLQADGSTNGASGIQLAYEQAAASFIPGGVNRVILATDGDFNVGITSRDALLRLIEDKAKSGVFLSVLGVGMGNFKDGTLETLADKGNGNYAYLDTLNEARKVLVDQMSGTLVTMAKDVKVQVEFNPAVVDAYRLIGYENRSLRSEDFNNDLKDGGDMGAGHTVTVLYEVVPRGVAINGPSVDPLKYQQPPAPSPNARVSNETLSVKIRYKEPAASDSRLLVFPLVDREQAFARANTDFRFAAAVAAFGMVLRDSPFKGTATFDSVLSIAEGSLGSDRNGYRREFLQLVQRARQIRRR